MICPDCQSSNFSLRPESTSACEVYECLDCGLIYDEDDGLHYDPDIDGEPSA